MERIANYYQLDIELTGLNALAGFKFKNENNLVYKTLISQEMLKYGFLAANSIYVCISHEKTILEKYFEKLEQVFKTIKDCENKGLSPKNLLKGPICHDTFKRLN